METTKSLIVMTLVVDFCQNIYVTKIEVQPVWQTENSQMNKEKDMSRERRNVLGTNLSVLTKIRQASLQYFNH